MKPLAWLIQGLIAAAGALLGVGVTAPAMTLTTSFGKYDGWVRLLASDLAREQQTTYSLLSGILKLMETSPGIGVLLIVFTCLFPAAKLVLMAAGTETLRRGGRAGTLVKLVHHAGKFSMLDVLVLAMLVLAIKGLPGTSELTLGLGIWLFAASVLLSLVASLLMGRLERQREFDGGQAASSPV